MNTHKGMSRYKQALLCFGLMAFMSIWQPASAAGTDPDVTGDGRVNALDISTVASCMGRDLAKVARCLCADTNGDRIIDKLDYGFVGSKVGGAGYPLEPNACRATKNPKEQVIALENAGVIPKLERGNTVAGTDTNASGVRDDVEAFITSNYTTAPQRAAATQYAKGMQASLLVDTSNIVAVKEIKRRLSRASHCLYSKFDGAGGTKHPAQVGTELVSITTNTKQRLLAYLAYSKALDGTSWALPEGDTCE